MKFRDLRIGDLFRYEGQPFEKSDGSHAWYTRTFAKSKLFDLDQEVELIKTKFQIDQEKHEAWVKEMGLG